MIISGLITILFVVVHLKQFKYGPTYFAVGGQRDLYRLEVENFSNPLLVAFYLGSLVVLGLHLWHGFWSAFQSLGLGNARTTPRIMQAARAVGLVLIAGFLVIPVWVYFFGARP
jgi:succinate dehydrogenase / fumarate reductase cytochrome b subunit